MCAHSQHSAVVVFDLPACFQVPAMDGGIIKYSHLIFRCFKQDAKLTDSVIPLLFDRGLTTEEKGLTVF